MKRRWQSAQQQNTQQQKVFFLETPLHFLLFLFIFFLSIPSLFAATVDPAVDKAFAGGASEVAVIVTLNQDIALNISQKISGNTVSDVQQEVLDNLQVDDFDLTHQYASLPVLSGKVTEEGLEKMLDDPLVQAVSLDRIYSIVLDESIPQVKANTLWNLSVNGIALTGAGETVCVIDTGIDTDHPAFQDKIKAQHCFCSLNNADGLPCCPNNQTEDTSAEDDHGHGTHVAGTAMGNYTTYTGIAKDANVVAIKVCTAGGSCASSDIISAIDWCSYNATVYNISAISISIGGGGPYNSYCNSDSIAPAINTAVGKNISVVVAAGNNGYTTGISSPACVQNATPIGAVDGSDVIFYNRGTILELLAPGKSITAPYFTGGTATMSGTSMSTPHVSGAIALLRQYWRLAYGKIPTPAFLEKKLALTGKSVYDSSSQRTYARLDVLAAVKPYLNYTSTNTQESLITSLPAALVNVTSDVDLSTAYVRWNFSNGSSQDIFLNGVVGQDTSGQEVTYYALQQSSLSDGTHTYIVYGNDSVNTVGATVQRNLTVDTVVPTVTFLLPTGGTTFNDGTLLFNATVTDARLQSVQFIFTNASGNDFVLSQSNADNISVIWKTTADSWAVVVAYDLFAKGNQSVTVRANDTTGNTNQSEMAYFTVTSLTVTPPSVTFVNSSVVHIEEKDYLVSQVIFAFDNATGIDFNLSASNTSGNWNVSGSQDIFTEGNHEVRVYATDSNGNSNSTEMLAFVIDRTPPSVSIHSPSAGTSFDSGTGNYSFNVSVQDLLPSGNLSVMFTLVPASGTSFNITPRNDSGIWKASYNFSNLPDGTQTLVVIASDTKGNMNSSASVNFTVDGTTAPTVTLSSPQNNFFTSDSSSLFTCSATDQLALSSLTLYGNWSTGWHANQTVTVSGTSNQSTFSGILSDGSYRWNCLATDTAGHTTFAGANFTLVVDTLKPMISGIAVSSITSSGATVSWTTSEQANASVNYGTSQSLGMVLSKTSRATAQSFSLTGLSVATTYFYNVTSCDIAGNCNSSSVQNFTTLADSSEDSDAGSSDSAGGGGAGGGGGGAGSSSESSATPTSAVAASAAGNSEAVSSEEIKEESSPEIVQEPQVQQTSSGSVSQEARLVDGESLLISFSDALLAVRGVELTSRSDQTATVSAIMLSGKPADVPEALQAYQYLEISTSLDPEELKNAKVTFAVPKSWLQEQEYAEKKIRLQTYEDGEWVSLKTKVISNDDNEVVYEAKVKHFSYFVITAAPDSPGLVGGAVSGLLNAVPGEIDSKTVVFFGMGLVIVLLGIVYFSVREREE